MTSRLWSVPAATGETSWRFHRTLLPDMSQADAGRTMNAGSVRSKWLTHRSRPLGRIIGDPRIGSPTEHPAKRRWKKLPQTDAKTRRWRTRHPLFYARIKNARFHLPGAVLRARSGAALSDLVRHARLRGSAQQRVPRPISYKADFRPAHWRSYVGSNPGCGGSAIRRESRYSCRKALTGSTMLARRAGT